ncbi:MAG: ATP-binding cassette domain-containing protein [Burkholderiales bacterium]|jgi:ABC-type nitrate/sulfonate/bicarbonate transport system ATPase subunit|nr:ATP-binding cassette domain-containing protein [Burkholderiales bacterium]
MTPFAVAQGLALRHPGHAVCENLSFTVPGSVRLLSICGPSGSGKTTLLRALAGLHAPSGGSLRVLGEPVAGTRRSLGYLPQSLSLFPWKTVRENVEFGLLCQGVAGAERRERADAMLADLGLAAWADSAVAKLSGGMRQRAAIARALVTQPEAVLLDEPFSALDFRATEQLCSLLSRLAAQASRFVVVTHDLRAAAFLSDAVVMLTHEAQATCIAIDAPPHPRPPACFTGDAHHRAMQALLLAARGPHNAPEADHRRFHGHAGSEIGGETGHASA